MFLTVSSMLHDKSLHINSNLQYIDVCGEGSYL